MKEKFGTGKSVKDKLLLKLYKCIFIIFLHIYNFKKSNNFFLELLNQKERN